MKKTGTEERRADIGERGTLRIRHLYRLSDLRQKLGFVDTLDGAQNQNGFVFLWRRLLEISRCSQHTLHLRREYERHCHLAITWRSKKVISAKKTKDSSHKKKKKTEREKKKLHKRKQKTTYESWPSDKKTKTRSPPDDSNRDSFDKKKLLVDTCLHLTQITSLLHNCVNRSLSWNTRETQVNHTRSVILTALMP